MMKKKVAKKPETPLDLRGNDDPIVLEESARSFLEFAKQHMERTNREAGAAVYAQSLNEVNRALGNVSTYLSELSQPDEGGARDFDTDPNIKSPEYRAAKETYDKYVQMVKAGEYEDHDQMIALYSALLETVPSDSLLAERIWEEINDHESDKIADKL